MARRLPPNRRLDPYGRRRTPAPRKKLPYVIMGVSGFVVLVQLVLFFFPTKGSRLAMSIPTATLPRPTRTYTPTVTALPPTFTPTLTHTATQVPPTATPLPTNTPAPTDTPEPTPTNTRRPTRRPPTPKPPPTPVPVGFLGSMPVNNGEWGTEAIHINYPQESVYATGRDGNRYKCELGFWNHPQSLAKGQEFWGYGGRGEANWKMIIEVRTSVAWISCPSSKPVCYEQSVWSGQASLVSKVFYKTHVWEDLLNRYLDGGWQATTASPHYHDIQGSIFNPICGVVPDFPVVGFRFTRG